MKAQAFLLLVIAALTTFGGIRALVAPATSSANRFQPWTYRRIEHTPTDRDIRNEKALGALLLIITCAALVLFAFDLTP